MVVPVAVTVTPGRTAPLSSTTSPWIEPVEPAPPWASAGPAASTASNANSHCTRFLIGQSLLNLDPEEQAKDQIASAAVERGRGRSSAGVCGTAGPLRCVAGRRAGSGRAEPPLPQPPAGVEREAS